MIHAELDELGEPFVARRGREHRRAGAVRELDRRDADTARSGLDEHGLARLEVPELEQAVVRGPERDRHARARHEIGTVGDHPCEHRRHRDDLGVRSPQHRRDDTLTDAAVGDRVTDLRIVPAHW